MLSSFCVFKTLNSSTNTCLFVSTFKMPKGKNKVKNDGKDSTVNNPVSLNKNGNVEIKILAKPGAKISCVTGVEEEGVGVQISAPPVDGEANEELVKFMSKVLDLRKSNVSLSKGSKSRQKTLVLLDTKLTCDDVICKLKQKIDK